MLMKVLNKYIPAWNVYLSYVNIYYRAVSIIAHGEPLYNI